MLNAHFVPIKVDREERPDIDALYMGAVQAMTGQGGWPMSVFLTPEGRPFYGGTYFPAEPRHGMPSFRQVLDGVRRCLVRSSAPSWSRPGGRLVAALAGAAPGRLGRRRASRSRDVARRGARARIEAAFDPVNGGWGGAPSSRRR